MQTNSRPQIPKVLVTWAAITGGTVGFCAGVFFSFVSGLFERVFVMGFGVIFSAGFAIGAVSLARHISAGLKLNQQIAFRIGVFCLSLIGLTIFLKMIS